MEEKFRYQNIVFQTFPVPPVGGTKQNCPVEIYLFAEARFKRPPKKDDTENTAAQYFDINYTY